MKIILDQNIPCQLKSWLAAMKPNWEVLHTSDIGLNNASDEVIFAKAQELQAVIITFDEDFSDIRLFSLPHAGIIRLNVWPTIMEEITGALKRLFDALTEQDILQSLIIIDQSKIRVRKIN